MTVRRRPPSNAGTATRTSELHASDDAIDEKSLVALAEMTGSAALVVELIDVYLTDTAERVASMREAAAGGDTTAVRRLAHTLRGSSASIGAHALAALGDRVEQTFTAESADSRALLERLVAEFDRVRASLQRRQGRGRG
jgi:HPt (histidine-containing phosphotransfer) domain-containing protein